ncbi:MAG: hypothetical protein RJA22_1961 [Verrucomicrobiota bacterium]|jgi:hypothetical protein
MKLKTLSLVSATLLALATQAFGQGSSFYFTSLPGSLVGQGQTMSVNEAGGYTFSATLNANNSISLTISSPVHTWNLSFAAPDGGPLTVGTYNNAQLWPNQAAGAPAMAFTRPGVSLDSIVGYFNILNVEYGPNNTVRAFDAEFQQYDNGVSGNWSAGNISFIAANPVPEPGAASLMGVGLLTLLATQRFLRRRS